MRILVPLHPLLDPAGFIVNRRAGRVFVNREEYVTDPADRCALEAAILIRDSTGAEIIAATIGSARNEEALREALALGAGRAVRVDAGELDECASARALAGLAERLGGVELALVGQLALDTGAMSVGPMLAGTLDWAFIGEAWSVRLSDEGGSVKAIVRGGNGGWEEVEVALPAVVSVPTGANRPRLPNGARLLNAHRAEANVRVMSPADLGLTAGDLQPRVALAGRIFPPEREPGRRLEGTLEEIASTLASTLQISF